MLLAFDIGNTLTVIGVFDGDKLIANWRLATDKIKTVDEYGILIKNLFADRNLVAGQVTEAVLSSVVPPVTGLFEKNRSRAGIRRPLKESGHTRGRIGRVGRVPRGDPAPGICRGPQVKPAPESLYQCGLCRLDQGLIKVSLRCCFRLRHSFRTVAVYVVQARLSLRQGGIVGKKIVRPANHSGSDYGTSAARQALDKS